ncbi:hypothetical protein J7M22_14040 [Candidatus Poribacteria bacterium]|nr:hypothetical protein [Candidatus Poribacteria bacterium]
MRYNTSPIHKKYMAWTVVTTLLESSHLSQEKEERRELVQIAGCNEVLRWSEVLDGLVGKGEAKAA